MLNDKISISSLLDADSVLLVKDPNTSKELLITQLSALACKDLSAEDAKDILERVLKREQGITTTLDTGLSIPHCRVDELDSFKAALAVIPQGIKDPLTDNITIKVMFLFLSPSNPAFFQKHLQMLAELSEKFKDSFISKLTQAAAPQEIIKIIKE
ncbi:PTS IIA-family protein [Elusimicrobium minutum Pei191]|uniref:PTS IIA-family protein n=1 Tax=Elusimicrobium minutum (strain Pei191) TaxID=445932 RepID=B2KDQ9_ELUMP|nr:PTS sugar transporter subunit IIA [Elusimicrobium minutum]ACC98655.1 PTS IIA-family protein [Elusimicrobium minutum Pei191]